MKYDLEIILKEKKHRKSRSSEPLRLFSYKFGNSKLLFDRVIENVDENRLIQEAKGQYIISLVTASEVYLRETFITLIDKYNFEISEIKNEFNRKFDIDDFLFISKKKISIGELIASQFNFQELNNINKAYSKLLTINFFNKIKIYKWEYGEGENDYLQLEEDFYPKLEKLLNLRHNFTHDIFFDTIIELDEIEDLSTHLHNFIYIIEMFIYEEFFQKM